MKRAKKNRLKRLVKTVFFAIVMIGFSGTLYFSQAKNITVNYLGDVINFRTMAKTVSEAFKEKGIIISEGLTVSKGLESDLIRNDEIFIDAPIILAMAEETNKETVPVVESVACPEQNEVKEEMPEVKKEEVKKVPSSKSTKATSRATVTPRTWYDNVKEVEPGVIETADGKLIEYTDVIQMEATAYCACYSCCGKWPSNKYYGITKTGTRAKVGTIAVDPRKIPLGTSLYIEGLNGAKNYGSGKAEDIGGAIKGNIIDLYFDTHAETVQWGRQQVKVYILKDN